MIDDLIAELDILSESDVRPFPYEACRLLQRDDRRYATLIPDLDSYFSELAGYRSWGRRILGWPDEKIEHVRRWLERSFNERFPVYRHMQVSSADRSVLREALEIAERTRTVLLRLLDEIQAERTGIVKSYKVVR